MKASFFAAALAACIACVPARAPTPDTTTKTRIVARRFAFSPAEIRVRRGTRTSLELTSLDVVHGFSIVGAGLNVRADVVPGHVTRLQLAPQTAGTYAISCDVFCGEGHDEMSATLTVTE